jgi:uncharacterized RDD family membrane protein YckC
MSVDGAPLDGPPLDGPLLVPASLVQRVGGALVDGLLTSMVIVVPVLLGLVKFDDLQELRLSAGWTAALGVAGAAYTIVPTALWGQTAGKLAVGTRVVVDPDGSLPGLRRSGVRWFVAQGVARLPYVGLLISLAVLGSVVLDDRRRGLHDKAAGTIVVRANPPVEDAP